MGKRKNNQGFTLMEVLITLTLLCLVLGTFYRIFLSQAEAYRSQAGLLERQQGLRAGLEMIVRDFRSSGYPLLDASCPTEVTAWLDDDFFPRAPLKVIPSGVITITSGGQYPDVLSLMIVLPGESNPAPLAQGALSGDVSLSLSLSRSQTEDQYNVSDLIYIGKPAELAQVKEVSGSVLVIDTDPLLPGDQGLKKSYPAGTEVGEISLVSYAVFNDENDPGGKYHDLGVPVLKRKINSGGFYPLTENLSDLKVSQIKSGLYRLQLSGRTNPSRPARQSAGERELTMSTQIMKRN
jgi:prepilin-type N-terminal cleavage/methylation domain-containing protein